MDEANPMGFYLEAVVPFNHGELLPLRFFVVDAAELHGSVADATEVNMQVVNDLSNTITLFADVYDSNMILLPGIQVTSSEGVNYRNFATYPSTGGVPPPPAGPSRVLLTKPVDDTAACMVWSENMSNFADTGSGKASQSARYGRQVRVK